VKRYEPVGAMTFHWPSWVERQPSDWENAPVHGPANVDATGVIGYFLRVSYRHFSNHLICSFLPTSSWHRYWNLQKKHVSVVVGK
jgi:hypothetical protein